MNTSDQAERRIYTSSKGQQLAIDAMPFPYLKSALAKLQRENPERVAEIEAMRAELTKREAEYDEASH